MRDSRPSLSFVARAQPWLGTVVEIRTERTGQLRWRLMATLDAAFTEVEHIHRLLSRQERGRDIVALANAAVGDTVPVDRRTAEVLRLALDLQQQSAGLFEPEWRDCREHRDTREFHDRRIRAGASAYSGPAWAVDAPDCVRILRRAVVDLDGIAKGYAVDRAIAILESDGVRATVNAGGDLRTTNVSGEPLMVRCPLVAGGLVSFGRMGTGAFATSQASVPPGSGLASAGIDDRRDGGRPLSAMTVSVAAPSCALADALTKVVAVDPDFAADMLDSRGACAWILREFAGELRMRQLGSSAIVTPDAA